MNTEVVIPPGELIDWIFDRHRVLIELFNPIKIRNGHRPVEEEAWGSIDSPAVQRQIREALWYGTEELSEALEHRGNLRLWGWRGMIDRHKPTQQFFEEVVDALSFFVEASLYAGLSPTTIHSSHDMWRRDAINRKGDDVSRMATEVVRLCGETVFRFGLAANCLENKPWRNTRQTTDKSLFERRMKSAWESFGRLWAYLGCSLDEIYSLYMAKQEINIERTRGNY